MRAKARAVISHPLWERGVIALIIINAIILGMETVPSVMADIGATLLFIDHIILWMFVVELTVRLYVHRSRFFRDPWSLFDTFVVGIAFIPDGGAFSVLRALRVLRVLRLISAIPSMRRVVAGLLAAIPGMTSIFGLMLIFFYVAAVMATNLFGESNPPLFGNLATSAFTLFQVMTLEGWSDEIVRPVMDNHPYAWAFFVPFILLATFTMLNLFIAVMVSAIQIEQDEAQHEIEAIVHDDREEILREIRALRDQLNRLEQSNGSQ
ncbi:MAG: ion transporter [Alphaproteobacteria bacterium]|nr:ion transporter [Alphaproteobacteria bacterium SS10]